MGISAEPLPGEDSPRCTNCGSPRGTGPDEAPYLEDDRNPTDNSVINPNIADTADELKIALAGPDWHCSSCGASNRASRTSCVSCGNQRYNPSIIRLLIPSSFWSWLRVILKMILQIAWQNPKALGIALVFTLWSCLDTERTTYGTVQHASYEVKANRERFEPAERSGWKDEIKLEESVLPIDGRGARPGASNIRDCRLKHRRYESYECGTEPFCEMRKRDVRDGNICEKSCSTHDNGNGSFTERCAKSCIPKYRSESYEHCGERPKTCNRSITSEWCVFDAYQWVTKESKVSQGRELPIYRHQFPKLPLERTIYAVTFAVELRYGNGKVLVYQPKTEDDYARFLNGQSILLTTNLLGGNVKVADLPN